MKAKLEGKETTVHKDQQSEDADVNKVVTNYKRDDKCNDSLMSEIKITPVVNSLNEIAGLKHIKNELISILILPINQPQLYKSLKICNSILLYGPPGTGKTMLAHGLAAEIDAEFYYVSPSNITSKYFSESERFVIFFIRLAIDRCVKCCVDQKMFHYKLRHAYLNHKTRLLLSVPK